METEDTKSTFTADDSDDQSVDLQPAAGEIWQITVMAAITANGNAGDDLYVYVRTDNGDLQQVDTAAGATANVSTDGTYTISNDCYIRVRITTAAAIGQRTVTYWYQAFKVS